MITDFDTKNLKLKAGDLLMWNGEKMSAINVDDLLKPLTDKIVQQATQLENAQKLLAKADNFIRALGKRILGEEAK